MIKRFKVLTQKECATYPHDVRRVQEVVVDHGYECAYEQAEALWQAYSDSLWANWLDLPLTNAAVWQVVEPFIEDVDN